MKFEIYRGSKVYLRGELKMDDKTRILLLQTAAFLKMAHVDKLVGGEQATREANELMDKIGKALADDQAEGVEESGLICE